MVKCKQCGRNWTGKLKSGMCGECAKMEYLYNQGAITTNDWKKWAKEWIKDFK